MNLARIMPGLLFAVPFVTLSWSTLQAQPGLAIAVAQAKLAPPVGKRLTLLEVSRRMNEIPNWKTNGKQVYCTRKFNNFVEAMTFVNQLVEPAERAAHHPDIQISYNQVTLSLTTHDVGGLTDQDFQLAAVISKLANSNPKGTGC